MLAAVVPADVHQLHGVERAAAAPRRAGAVRGLALERVLDRDQAVAAAVAPPGRQVGADVVVEDDVHVLEHAGAHVIRLGRELFLGDARPEHERAGQLLALHDPLHRDRGDDVERHAGVVALAVAGRAVDDRRRDRRRRASATPAGMQSTSEPSAITGLPDPQRAIHAVGNAGDAALDGEAVLLEDAGQVALGLELLEAELDGHNDYPWALREHRSGRDFRKLDISTAADAHDRHRTAAPGRRRRPVLVGLRAVDDAGQEAVTRDARADRHRAPHDAQYPETFELARTAATSSASSRAGGSPR